MAAYAQTSWKKKPLGVPGWELHEKGDWFEDPSNAIVQAVWSNGKTRFSIGCTFGSSIDVTWQPSAPFAAGLAAPVTFSIDGGTVATRSFAGGEANPYGWSEPGSRAGPRRGDLHQVDWQPGHFRRGVIDTIAFDEQKLGGVSEVVLMACGK
ncbi:MAG: hypothetical protein IPO30_15710 [Hyphomonadaceae bacterium]|nr:hypothetical protein [Hyphomonadaceae bacterium]